MTDRALKLLLDFDARVQREKSQPADFLHRRDRRFALSCIEHDTPADARGWLDHLNRLSGAGDEDTPAVRSIRQWRQIGIAFGIAGSVFGVVTMLGLLVYEGGQRINLSVLIAFVLLQVLLAMLTTLQAALGWQPWRVLLTRLQRQSSTQAMSAMQPLLMARAAHLGGLCFGLMSLLTLLVALVIQDLAFGWSTTLSTVPAGFTDVTAALAWPWRGLWPAAVPDLSLVEATRFYRSADGMSDVSASRWGEWWPFVLMLWSSYVVLPRAILLAGVQVNIVWRAKRALQTHAGWRALQYRMQTPTVDTGNSHNDAEDAPVDFQGRSSLPLPAAAVVIYWGGVADDSLPAAVTEHIRLACFAGGRASLASDRQTLSQIASALANGAGDAVLLVTRGWEPPTGELHDFIEEAQSLWPSPARLTLIPLAQNTALPVPAHQLPQWLRLKERFTAGFVTVSLIESPLATAAAGEAHA